MAKQHEHAEAFISFLNTTQQAYETRRLDDYIAAFAADYCTVQLHAGFHEDLGQLRAKIAADMEKYELLSMDFRMLDDWYTGEIGYAHMSYVTRLRFRDSGRVLIDERDAYLSQRIRETEGERIVAVVGAGHVEGMRAALQAGRETDLAVAVQ